MGQFSNFMQDTHKENRERVVKEKEEREKKEEKDKEEKEKKEEREAEKERRHREREAEKERRYEEREAENDRRHKEASEERRYAYQVMIRQDNKSLTLPYSVITGGTSEVNYSTSIITATSSSQLMVTPRREFKRLHRIDRERDEETSNANLIEQSATKKRKADKIKTTDTVTTTENES